MTLDSDEGERETKRGRKEGEREKKPATARPWQRWRRKGERGREKKKKER